MAICDACYVFTHIDIGSYGSKNDSGVFRNSKMGEIVFREIKCIYQRLIAWSEVH